MDCGVSNMSHDLDPDAKPCPRCGQYIPGYVLEARKKRNAQRTDCADCEAGQRKHIRYGNQVCVAWVGDIDLDTMQPLDERGRPHMPGIRTCGHNDCVNSAHVMTWQKLEAERHDISYRTGVRLTHRQLVIAVKREGRLTV